MTSPGSFCTIIPPYVLDRLSEQGHEAARRTLALDAGHRAARLLAVKQAPGTAYDDPRLGKDPQPAHMSDFVETTDDQGGVHINSGIPNHAFQLLATALGGHAWERAGQVWYDTLTGGQLAHDADFAAFARATVAAARARYDDESVANTVVASWSRVGVSTT